MTSISLNGVGVTFPIFGASHRSLKQHFVSLGTGGRLASPEGRVCVEALSDISASFRHGDRVALLGHNGAGKTTLLRVLAGIYEPTRGSVHIHGRIAPVFDIGLGMDPDSTGYENIRLRGLYLGLQKAQIRSKLDEIAEFTELGSFLDMPVRTYSAGMQARLAFAVSTSIEPEILLLDEGISAGDANFAVRARARVRELIDRSGILVLASHSTALVRSFCTVGMLMESGHIRRHGPLEEVLADSRLSGVEVRPAEHAEPTGELGFA